MKLKEYDFVNITNLLFLHFLLIQVISSLTTVRF